MADEPTQLGKFKACVREGEADPDENAWDERLKKVAKQNPAPPEKTEP